MWLLGGLTAYQMDLSFFTGRNMLTMCHDFYPITAYGEVLPVGFISFPYRDPSTVDARPSGRYSFGSTAFGVW